MAWPRDTDGWTTFTPKTDGTSAENTWVYYVDPINGDDATGIGYEATDTSVVGSDPFQPVGTPAAFATPEAARNAAASRKRFSASNWILLKRGTEFSAANSGLGGRVTGYSQQYPWLWGAYGNGARPVLKAGTTFTGGGGMSEEYHDLAFLDIDFYDTQKDPAHPDYVGWPTTSNSILFTATGTWSQEGDQASENILFENCRIRFMQLVIGGASGQPKKTGVEIRRCSLGPNYSVGGGHTQIILLGYADGAVFEDCVAYYGGWWDDPTIDSDAPGAENDATVFNRNFYISGSASGTVMRNVLSVKSSSASMQLRAGGSVEYCYHSHNPMGVLFGSKENSTDMSDSFVTGNVIDLCFDTGIPSFGDCVTVAASQDGYDDDTAIQYDAGNVTISDNIFSTNLNEVAQACITLDPLTPTYGTKSIAITSNIIYNWASNSGTNLISLRSGSDAPQSISLSENDIQEYRHGAQIIDTDIALDAGWSFASNNYHTTAPSSAWFDNNGVSQSLAQWASSTGDTSVAFQVSYTDSSRTLLTYAASLGDSTLDEFMQKALANERGSWDWRYTAYAAIDYVRVGFDKPLLSGGSVSPQYLAFRDGSSSSFLSLSAGGQFIVLQT